MENKDSTAYQSRKYKVNLSGMVEASGTFVFDVPPPSDIAFSDKYRSALIMLRSIDISMYPAQCVLDAGTGQLFGRGMDALWVNNVNAIADDQFVSPSAGIIIETDLPCKQNAMAQTNVAVPGAPVIAVNAAGGVLGNGRYCKTISDASIKNGNIGRVNNTGQGAGLPGAWNGTYQAINIDGTQELRINCGGAGVVAPHTGVSILRKPIWSYESTANILDEGLLGATPFGRQLQVRLRDAITGDAIWLYSKGTPMNVAANQRTCIKAEFEFLMMP